MTNKTKGIAARFSAAATTYRRHAYAQQRTAINLAYFMRNLPCPERILEIGCGTGVFTEQINGLFTGTEICALDISEGMIKEAKVRLSKSSNIEWITGSLGHLQPHQTFNLITSSSALHWITPIENTFRTINKLLLPDGHLAFSINVRNTFKELHTTRLKIAPHKKNNRLPTSEIILETLQDTGFSVAALERNIIKSDFASATEFLRAIHEQGLTSGPVSNSGTLLNRQELKNLISYYDTHYKNSNGGVFATYESILVLATKDKKS